MGVCIQTNKITERRDHSIHTERASMRCQDIAWGGLFYTGLTSAEGQQSKSVLNE
jgi:hypothetical protein